MGEFEVGDVVVVGAAGADRDVPAPREEDDVVDGNAALAGQCGEVVAVDDVLVVQPVAGDVGAGRVCAAAAGPDSVLDEELVHCPGPAARESGNAFEALLWVT